MSSAIHIPAEGIPENGISLNTDFWVSEDQTNSIDITDYLSGVHVDWVASDDFYPNSNRSVFWVKTKIQNDGDESVAILKFDHISHLSAFVVEKDVVTDTAYAGEYSKYDDRRIKDGRLYLQLTFPKGESNLYLKIKQRKNFAPILNFKLQNVDSFFNQLRKRTFLESLVFGSFVILFIYGMILFAGNGHKPYLWLSLTTLMKAVFFSQMIGYFSDVFMSNHPKFAMDMLVVLMYASGITSLLLVRDFINLKQANPTFNRILNGFMVFLAIQCAVLFYIKFVHEDYLLANRIGFSGYIPQGIFLVYMFVMLLPKIPKFKRPIIYGIMGFATLTLVTSINFLLNLENSYGNFTWNEVIGTLLFLLLYFYTLGREMQLHEKEKNKALERVNVITQNQKEELEKTVKERTLELETTQKEIEFQNKNLKNRNDQIEILLKEIHHRVKNNLQVVSSLLDLQSKEIEDEGALQTFMQGQNRVKAMALIHQKLYQNEELATIDFEDYAKNLMSELREIYPIAKSVTSSIRSSGNAQFDIDTAIPLGLILNELISNAYKYAFNDIEKGILEVEIAELGRGRYQLIVKDTGNGLPDSMDFTKAKSLGLRLVRRLSKQLHGEVTYRTERGAIFVINFADTYHRKIA